VTLLISVSYYEYVPLSTITNIPFYYHNSIFVKFFEKPDLGLNIVKHEEEVIKNNFWRPGEKIRFLVWGCGEWGVINQGRL
jgi:hypothetical protein